MKAARGFRLRRALACACGLALAAPVAAHASESPSASLSASVLESACSPRAIAANRPAQGWPAPLDRILSLNARDVSLRDALDRVSAGARIRISYSPELLPLDRRVCVASTARTVGDALAELLRDTPVEPVVAGADHVVLALRRTRAAAAENAPPPDELGHTVALAPVVVTGGGADDAGSARPYALDVVGSAQLAREGTAPLSRLLNAASAGTWGWETAPSSLWTRFGSIRGASSFGASAPRVFIDGIEVANPLLATQIAPEAVERIEVVRGPQGAALQGTGAISGVVNIVTRHEGTDGGAPALRVRGGLGMANSDFAAGGTVAQEHALGLRMGTRARSAGLDVGFGGVGEYVPRGGSRYLVATGNARRLGATTVLTGTARFYSARLGAGQNPLLDDLLADSLAPGRQRMTQYTLGGSLRWTPDARWTHTLVAGLDGGQVAGLADERSPLPSSLASGMAWMEGGADRLTLRWSSAAGVYDGERGDLSVTLDAEHSTLREQMAQPASSLRAEGIALPGAASRHTRDVPAVASLRTTALSAQGSATWDDRLHLAAGLRVEQNGGIAGGARYAALPVLGAAWVAELGGDATIKLRAAYGKGIRPARVPGPSYGGWYAAAGYLAPEEQSGIEGGVDLALGDLFQLQVTAYDQLASGLVQRVARPAVAVLDGGWRDGGYALQNVGQISNRGWEMQGSALLGRLSLEGAFASVDSRVRRLADGYTGDLRTGDRMLEVPARTLALTGAWAGDGWTASLTGTRAFDWINYDRLALARDWTRGALGADLRGYWRAYEGVTRLNATATLDVPGGVTLVLLGENLLNHQRGEPDNLTVVPGRTLTLGVRAAF